ncbi:MAG TPA: spermidine synthase [Thermodesulfobacteriota bacterium]|nr:spermidine synthase [Thermodesulfobacteriota bacterium]
MNKNGVSISIFFFLFALSGFSGLIYESIWTHYLKLFLGHAAYAQTLVLAIFMGGMAIGSWVCSVYSVRWRNLILGYAFTEGIVGLIALVFHSAFVVLLDIAYDTVMPQLGSPALVTAFKWGLSALMILPQSILLGMTFPLMSSGIVRRFPQRPGRSIAMLYFTNSIGGTMGVLASGFLLIKLFGLPGTIRIAGLINILLAVMIWGLVGWSAEERAYAKLGIATASKQPPVAWYDFFLLASLVTGASSFIYEVGWIRMLSLVLGASTHAFELMLSAFILGLAFGGLWIQRRIDAVPAPVLFLGQVQVIMGLLALSTLVLYGTTFDVMQWLMVNINKTDAGYSLFNLSRSAIAMAIMLPATFCAGMTLPLITFILMKQGHGERSIGAVYAANTIGAIFGVFFAIHIGMEGLGLKGLITFGAGLDIALGIALFWHERGKHGVFGKQATVGIGAVMAILGTILFVDLDPYKMGSGVYRNGGLITPATDRLLYHRDGKTASISCFLSREGNLSIRTNGKPDAVVMLRPEAEHTYDESTMILLAVLPMFFHPQAKTAAAIGFGSGYTSHMFLANPGLTQVDTIEIERNMVDAAQHFRPMVDLVFTDKRSRVYFDDAKTFFSKYGKRYDIIVSEPSNPWVSGVAGLFSTEFYRRIKRHLNEDGLLVQWVQLYEINANLVLSILKAISENFEDYASYAIVDGDMMIIAKRKGTLPHADYSVMKVPAIATALHRVHIRNEQDISIRKIGTKRFFKKFLKDSNIPANSDYYPYLDQNAERARFLQTMATDFGRFTYFPLPAEEMLDPATVRTGSTEITPCQRYSESQKFLTAMGLRDYFLNGHINQKNIPTDLMQKAVAFKQNGRGGPSLNEQERLGILFNLSVAMLPYLTTAELKQVWKSLETSASLKAPLPLERQWERLFMAVSSRDSVRMLAEARDLLSDPRDLEPPGQRYLLATAMLGALTQGDRAEALRLLSHYKTLTFGNNESHLLFQLLAAEGNVY